MSQSDLCLHSLLIPRHSSLPRAVSFLLHCPARWRPAPGGGTVTGGGRYPPPCPVEPGLSSRGFRATVRPTDRLELSCYRTPPAARRGRNAPLARWPSGRTRRKIAACRPSHSIG